MKGESLLEALFVSRTYHLRLQIANQDSPTGSRIGGRPPEILVDRKLTCPLCGGPVLYYLTVESDILSCEVCTRGAVSVFYCANDTCLRNGRQYRVPSPVLCVSHERSPRATTSGPMDSPLEGVALLPGELGRDRARFGSYEQGSKVGGLPGLVQDEGVEELKRLENDNLHFLFQINEEDYPRGLRISRYPFGFGTLYVFCRGRGGQIPRDTSTCAAFWESP